MSNAITSGICQTWDQYNDAVIHWIGNHRDESAIGATSAIFLGIPLLKGRPLSLGSMIVLIRFGLPASVLFNEIICKNTSSIENFDLAYEFSSQIPLCDKRLFTRVFNSALKHLGFTFLAETFFEKNGDRQTSDL